jgi:sensor histidine kinase YesM
MKLAPPLLRGWRAWLAWLPFWTFIGLLGFSYKYLDVLARARTEPVYEKLIEELTGAYGTGLLFLGMSVLARWIVANDVRWYRAVPLHALAVPLYSALHTSWLWFSRRVIYALLGLGSYDYGIMPIRYAMEFPNDLIDYALLASILHLILHYRSARERELRLAQLETELTQTRLRALEGQLRPHFLFNALNTVSSIMYRDVGAADRVLRQLGDLLRSSLRTDGLNEVSLHEEIATLELYLAVMRARFGDRLEFNLAVDASAHDALVPYLLLQPLVENALEHGDPGPGQPARIDIRAQRRADLLVLQVEDNGPGWPAVAGGTARADRASELPHAGDPRSATETNGIGLANTAARLTHLYGDRHSFELSNGQPSGFRVTIRIPYRKALVPAS